MAPHVTVLAAGAAKAEPFTVCIFANPFLETRLGSGAFAPDPVMSRQADFDASARYIAQCILGTLPGQAESLFDPAMASAARIVTVFATGLPAGRASSLVSNDSRTTVLLVPRRDSFRGLAALAGEKIDVGIAVSASPARRFASTWPASDDVGGPAIPFELDGSNLKHCLRTTIPGACALHVDERSMTPLHELQHGLGSFENGQIVDLYNDSLGINCKPRPIAPVFGTYQHQSHASDPNRDHLGYPPGTTTFHCALIDSMHPAVMDDYINHAQPLLCRNDTITRQFLIQRIQARMSR